MATTPKGNGRVLYLSEIGSVLPKDALREGNGRKLRSTPLPWLKFRTAADTTPEGTRYAMRRRAVKARSGGMAMLAVYDEMLLTYGGDRFAPLRGYVVNYHLRPASAAEIAMEIGCLEAGLLEAAIPVLLEVGLLSWRTKTMAEFKAAIDADQTMAPHIDPPDDPSDDPDDSLFADDARTPKCAPRRRPRARTKRKGAWQKLPVDAERPENRPPPLARELPGSGSQVASQAGGDKTPNTGDVRRETKDVTRETADAAAPGPAAQSPPPLPDTGNGKTGELKPETETDPSPAAAPPDGQTRDKSPADARTADSMPEDAAQGTQDAGDGPPGDDGHVEQPTAGDDPAPCVRPASVPIAAAPVAAPASVHPTKTDPRQGQGQGEWRGQARPTALCEAHVDIMVDRIMELLYPTHDDLVLQGRRHLPPQGPDEFRACERGCLDTAWTAVALVGLPSIDMLRLVEKAERHAASTRREKCKTTRGRKWMMWLNYYMRDLVGPRWQTARASARRGASGPP